MLDERLIGALHVEALRRGELHAEHEPHVLFQASTIAALLEGPYEGDVSFAELAEHGDLGLGTLNGLDGEMIAIDGGFLRADVDGWVREIPPDALTPFAVVVWFDPGIEFELPAPMSHDRFLAALDERLPAETTSCAIRVEGSFAGLRARSVPAQEPPYRPLGEVVADQHVFDLGAVSGTLVGFRFPDFAEGLEVSGYHLHFVSADRTRGGHVLECRPRACRVQLDVSAELHLELPVGVDLSAAHLSGQSRSDLDRAEHSG